MRQSMIPISATLATILLTYLCSTHMDVATAEQCGRQASGARCPNNICCSQWGWCGTSDAYCGSGCQSDCLQCGIKRDRLLCGDGRCCSQFGYCGTGSAYCCGGCQSNCRCVTSTSTSNTTALLNYLMVHHNTTDTLP